jgi:hypothetical protein
MRPNLKSKLKTKGLEAQVVQHLPSQVPEKREKQKQNKPHFFKGLQQRL